MAVTGQSELRLELGFVQLLFGFELKGVACQKRRRCQAVQGGGGRDEHQVGPFGFVALTDAPQGGQTFADQILVGREGVVGQCFPVGKNGNAKARCKEGHLVHQPLCVGRIRCHHGRQAALCFLSFGQLGQQHSICRADGAGQGKAFS